VEITPAQPYAQGDPGWVLGGVFVARILTIDDEQSIQELYEAVLGLAGHELAGQAFDGERGVTLFGAMSPRPDLVILDYRMPVLDGLAAATAILAKEPTARIVIISADTSIEKQAKEAGAAAFLAKPFPLADFLNLINRLVGPPDVAPLGGLAAVVAAA
jgi:DNA-binding NtrC family response regulator